MSLQERLDALKAKFEGKKASPAVVEIIHRATADLVASGQAGHALNTGDHAPSFSLPDADGMNVDSASLLARGALVITFYRGVWCPYCNLELEAIEATAADIRTRGASLVAISPQVPANSRKTKQQIGLSFPILSDQDGRIAAAFGIRFRLPNDLIEVYRGFGVDLPLINSDPRWTLPMPARYVIARDRSIAYAEVNPDYTRRPDPGELMPALERLQRASAA